MEPPTPLQQPPTPLPENQPTPPATSVSQTPKKPIESITPPPPPPQQQLDSSPPVADIINIPSCSRWFTWDKIHEPERRFLPEFFDGKSASKNEKVYMYYRNSMIKMFRKNPSKKITFTQVRKVLVGDVGSILRVFDFLESWGLINYTGMPSKPKSKMEDKENRLGSDFKGNSSDNSSWRKDSSTRFCSGCKSLCSIACFVCDKLDLTLCARCYVRGNHQASADDFRRVEISDQNKTEWTDKETLKLLEAIMHFGEDWKKVAEHVGGRTEKECVARFIKLPFKEQFMGSPESDEAGKFYQTSTPDDAETHEKNSSQSSSKKRRLTPFADTSNPIMAQVAFLSAIVGSEVAEAASRAAVEALSGSNLTSDQRGVGRSYMSVHDEKDQNGDTGGDNVNTLVEAVAEARAEVQREENDIEKSITDIVVVQMKELRDKIIHFEEVELQMEKEWKQLQYMKNLLFTDQLTLLSQKNAPVEKTSSGVKISEPVEETKVNIPLMLK